MRNEDSGAFMKEFLGVVLMLGSISVFAKVENCCEGIKNAPVTWKAIENKETNEPLGLDFSITSDNKRWKMGE